MRGYPSSRQASLFLLTALSFAASPARADDPWAITFVPGRLLANAAPPIPLVVVVPAGGDPESVPAARAFIAGLRRERQVQLVMDSAALGDLAALDDRAIVERAQGLPVAAVAVVRTFAGDAGRSTAVVTIYSKAAATLAALSGERGVPLAGGAISGQGVSPTASNAVAQAVQSTAPREGSEGAPELTQRPGSVPVSLESEGRPLQLSAIEDSGGGTGIGLYGSFYLQVTRYRSLCQTPCTLYLKPGVSELRVTGPGIRTANASLDVPPSGALVQLRAPSARKTVGAVVLMAAGGAALLSGVGLLALKQINDSIDPVTRMQTKDNTDGYLVGGAVAIGAGALALAGGLTLLVLNRGGVKSLRPRSVASLSPVVGPVSLGLQGTF